MTSLLENLSANKWLLFIAATVASLGSLATLGAAALIHWQRLPPQLPGNGFEALLLCLTSVVFIPGVLLMTEYARALRGGRELPKGEEDEFDFEQMRNLLRWCPAVVTIICLAALTAVCALLPFIGMHSWSSHEPMTLEIARATLLFHAPFFLFPTPIIISALRMPGSYASAFPYQSKAG